MKIPDQTKPAVWGAICGAVIITIVGFSANWVVTAGTASEMAENRAEKAVTSALTPICVAQFRSETQQAQDTQLAALEDESSWQQDDFVKEKGWATMPGSETPNDMVADACATQLLALAESWTPARTF